RLAHGREGSAAEATDGDRRPLQAGLAQALDERARLAEQRLAGLADPVPRRPVAAPVCDRGDRALAWEADGYQIALVADLRQVARVGVVAVVHAAAGQRDDAVRAVTCHQRAHAAPAAVALGHGQGRFLPLWKLGVAHRLDHHPLLAGLSIAP